NAELTILGNSFAGFDSAYEDHVFAQADAESKRAEKQHQRDLDEALVRGLVRKIQANPAVTDAQRQMLDITVPKSERTPVAVPVSRPSGTVVEVEGLTHVLRLADADSGKRT